MKLLPIQYSGVTIVEMDNKPALALAVENPKIKDYPVDKRNANSMQLVDWLLNLLGVGANVDNKLHHVESFNFINSSKMDKYTYEEFQSAFQMYIAGELPKDILIAQQLNPLVIGKVMNAYNDIKKERLKYYDIERKRQRDESENQISQEEKNYIISTGVLRCYKYFTQNNDIEDGRLWVYDWLLERGKINPTNDEKKKHYSSAIESLKRKAKEDVNRDKYKKIMNDLQNKKDGQIIIEAKKRIMREYFRGIMLANSNFEIASTKILGK